MTQTELDIEGPVIQMHERLASHAITIRQPWAWAIAEGLKSIENRVWRTRFRGPIYIHAAGGGLRAGDTDGFLPKLVAAEQLRYGEVRGGVIDVDKLVHGALIAVGYLTHCSSDRAALTEEDQIWAVENCWHFHLRSVRKLQRPIPCRGALGIWRVGGQDLGARLSDR